MGGGGGDNTPSWLFFIFFIINDRGTILYKAYIYKHTDKNFKQKHRRDKNNTKKKKKKNVKPRRTAPK